MAKRTQPTGSDEHLKPEVLAPEGDLTGFDEAGSPGDLERLRDILFGQQARTSAQRFAALETQLASLRRDLEQRMGTNADTASAQVQEARTALTQRLDELTASVQQLRTDTTHSDERLRQELLGLIAALDDRKAARHSLGQMLIEMGQRLQNG